MSINLDFGNVSDFTLPEGEYTIVCDKVEVNQKPGPDTFPYLSMQFSVTDEGDNKGKFVNHTASLAPKSRYFLQQMLEALTGKDWKADGMVLDPKELPGMTARVVTYQESYTKSDGKPGVANRVRMWLPKDDSASSVVAQAQAVIQQPKSF